MTYTNENWAKGHSHQLLTAKVLVLSARRLKSEKLFNIHSYEWSSFRINLPLLVPCLNTMGGGRSQTFCWFCRIARGESETEVSHFSPFVQLPSDDIVALIAISGTLKHSFSLFYTVWFRQRQEEGRTNVVSLVFWYDYGHPSSEAHPHIMSFGNVPISRVVGKSVVCTMIDLASVSV